MDRNSPNNNANLLKLMELLPDGGTPDDSMCSRYLSILRFRGDRNLQMGNAVPPIFGEIIAKEIIKSISVNVENIKVFSSPKYAVSNFETFVQ